MRTPQSISKGSRCLPCSDKMFLVVQPQEIRDEIKVVGICAKGVFLSSVPKLLGRKRMWKFSNREKYKRQKIP